MNFQPARYLRYGLWVCLYLILLTPLLIGNNFLFPFVSFKTFFFRILVEIALFLYLLLALADGNYRPRFNKLTVATLVFGVVVLLTSLTGVNSYRSLWGTIERGEGFLTISHVIVFCFLLIQAFRTRRQWLNYFSISVLISLLVGLYALAQAYTEISWVIGAGGRLSSTLGNAAYLGAYSVGHFWLCLILLFERKKLPWRILFSALAVFELFILWKSETRGALLALILTSLLLLVVLPLIHRDRRVKIVSLVLLVVILVGSFFAWSNRHAEWVKKSNTLSRLANISLNDTTTESRLLAWDSSWRGWQERFLLGYGWENYNIAFNKYFHPEIFRDNGSQIWFDRAHNTIFDVAVATGVLGLLPYLLIFIFSFYYLIKFMRRDRENLTLYLLTAAFLLCHFIQNIFVFDCLATYILLFMVLSFISFVVNKHENKYKSANDYINSPLAFYGAAFLGFVALVFAIFNFNLLPAKANIMALEGLKDFYAGTISQGIATMQEAISLNTYQTPEIRQKLADNIINLNQSAQVKDTKQQKENFNIALKAIKDNINDSPLDVQNKLYLMILYNSASRLDISLPNAVLRTGEEALKLSSTRPQIYFEMGQAAINLGNFKEGIGYFKKGVDLNPSNLDSRWLLLTAYIITGQNQAAIDEYSQMLQLGLVENIANLERLANLYALTKNHSTLVTIYEKLIQLNPKNLDYLQKLATSYQAIGQTEELNKIIPKILELNPGAVAGSTTTSDQK